MTFKSILNKVFKRNKGNSSFVVKNEYIKPMGIKYEVVCCGAGGGVAPSAGCGGNAGNGGNYSRLDFLRAIQKIYNETGSFGAIGGLTNTESNDIINGKYNS